MAINPNLNLILKNIDENVWHYYITPKLDIESCCQLRSVSKLFDRIVSEYLEKMCPSIAYPCRLIDTGSGDRPFINKWKVRQWVNELGPLIESNEGLTVLIMRDGVKLLKKAKELKIRMYLDPSKTLLETLDDDKKGTSALLIGNNVFKDSRNKSNDAQIEQLAEYGCELPTAREYLALCLFTQELFQTRLYRQEPTYSVGRSSTWVLDGPLAVGGFTPTVLSAFKNDVKNNCIGAGGCRRF